MGGIGEERFRAFSAITTSSGLQSHATLSGKVSELELRLS